ncbi:thiol:disulfide interchange protein DsbG [Xanthomonas citri]|uniref:thiol:disulfide interchange protein DsbG n=1 Tax=Xanthomonas citri TaxID=346 RepID=UPI000CCEC3C9|nr:thiol:disulfide interchange protein DsbG [Xanthomonas citri]PNV26565.1 thiol:disulfide interchange protein DsbG [Xanthomonas citri]
MDKKVIFIRAGLLALFLALSACGGQKAPQAQAHAKAANPAKAEAAVKNGAMVPTPAEQFLIGQGAKITKAFISESGLKAVVADNGRTKQLFYIAPNGKYLMSGTVYDSVGGNVTSNDVARGGIEDGGKAEALSAQARDALWQQAEKLNWIAEGEGDRVAYVIFDPSCPYCHQLWTKLLIEAGKVRTQVRWIPVAILAENSKNLAAAIYQSKDASDALHAMGDRTLTPVSVREETMRKLEGNLNLLRTSGYTGVPTILYHDDDGVQITMNGLQDETFRKIFN